MQRWEYHTVSVELHGLDVDALDDILRHRGQNGRELATAVMTQPEGGQSARILFTFKRPL